MALLERINANAEEVKPVDKPPESAYLQKLIGRVEARKWRDEMLQKTLERLCELQDELDFISHLKECTQCQFELAIDLTRYAGNHSGLWFISVINGDILPEISPDCPKVEDYDIGSYWTRENHAEAIRFILDRAKWAEPIIREELYTVIEFYSALENWDFKSPLPPFTSNEELFGLGML